jgi:single-strand DNA-binding protein
MKTMKNHVQLVGRLGANPQVKVAENGHKLARFSVAVNQSYKTKDGVKVSEVQWYPVQAWGKLANEVEQVLSRGMEVSLDGRLLQRSYTIKGGKRRSCIEVLVKKLMVVSKA